VSLFLAAALKCTLNRFAEKSSLLMRDALNGRGVDWLFLNRVLVDFTVEGNTGFATE
jgi:hypothetical protein